MQCTRVDELEAPLPKQDQPGCSLGLLDRFEPEAELRPGASGVLRVGAAQRRKQQLHAIGPPVERVLQGQPHRAHELMQVVEYARRAVLDDTLPEHDAAAMVSLTRGAPQIAA